MSEESKLKRKSSEEAHKKEVYFMVNKVNTFLKFKKTKEQYLQLKQIRANHKKRLREFYGPNVNLRKVFNINNGYKYEISSSR